MCENFSEAEERGLHGFIRRQSQWDQSNRVLAAFQKSGHSHHFFRCSKQDQHHLTTSVEVVVVVAAVAAESHFARVSYISFLSLSTIQMTYLKKPQPGREFAMPHSQTFQEPLLSIRRVADPRTIEMTHSIHTATFPRWQPHNLRAMSVSQSTERVSDSEILRDTTMNLDNWQYWALTEKCLHCLPLTGVFIIFCEMGQINENTKLPRSCSSFSLSLSSKLIWPLKFCIAWFMLSSKDTLCRTDSGEWTFWINFWNTDSGVLYWHKVIEIRYLSSS